MHQSLTPILTLFYIGSNSIKTDAGDKEEDKWNFLILCSTQCIRKDNNCKCLSKQIKDFKSLWLMYELVTEVKDIPVLSYQGSSLSLSLLKWHCHNLKTPPYSLPLQSPSLATISERPDLNFNYRRSHLTGLLSILSPVTYWPFCFTWRS
jgi:hypothetical protein